MTTRSAGIDLVASNVVFDPLTHELMSRWYCIAAEACLEAGTLATLAALQGPGAQAFLAAQGV